MGREVPHEEGELMQIGIGIGNTIRGISGSTIIAWARRSEERGFSTLATIGRVAYPSYEELVTLAAAAGATQRIGLLTDVLLAPLRDPVLLAKEAASLDQLSGGRFVLGVAVGGREDDFVAADKNFRDRGRRFDEDLELLHSAWRGELVAGSPQPVGPPPVRESRVPILIGGNSDAAIARVVRWGIGWTAGGGGPEMLAQAAAKVRQAWQAAGRPGQPRIVGLQYFALGPDAETKGSAYIKDYYGFAGPYAERIAQGVARTPEVLGDLVTRFADAGADELIFGPTIGEIDQVDLLADIVLPGQ